MTYTTALRNSDLVRFGRIRGLLDTRPARRRFGFAPACGWPEPENQVEAEARLRRLKRHEQDLEGAGQ